jgi:hypothetical protein
MVLVLAMDWRLPDVFKETMLADDTCKEHRRCVHLADVAIPELQYTYWLQLLELICLRAGRLLICLGARLLHYICPTLRTGKIAIRVRLRRSGREFSD